MSTIISYDGISPEAPDTVFVADGARLIGRVCVGERSSIWFNAVLRGDNDRIVIGQETNVQDGAVLHADAGFPCLVGDRVTVGHRAILHGCAVADDAVIGMGAIVLNGARVGREAFVAAGALVKEGQEIPDRALAVGIPAKVIRTFGDDENDRRMLERMREGAADYVRKGETYRAISRNR
ncbi:MAG: gamma carbonic anhydrase family protein [Candidatus Latescibacteria bacterium]|nr:gamma carbonic anhydrase family protein [Candidatus Latescibacterota bacterium]